MKTIVIFLVATLVTVALAAGEQPFSPLHYGQWGFDLSGMDRDSQPGDDFFAYANGKWLANTPIPGNSDRATLRAVIDDRTNLELRALLEEAAKGTTRAVATTEDKVGTVYRAFTNEQLIERLGGQPIVADLDRIRATSTKEQIGALMGASAYDLPGSFFNLTVDVDLKNPQRYAVILSQGGIRLPDRDYYLDPSLMKEKQAYRAYVQSLLELVHWPEPAASADAVLSVEERIAKVQWTRAQERDLDATYNAMTVSQLGQLAPGFPWASFLAGAGLPQVKRVIVTERSAFPQIAGAFADTQIGTLRAWLAFTLADAAAPYLSKSFVDAYFEFRIHTLTGQTETDPRWLRAVRAVAGEVRAVSSGPAQFGDMRWAVGRMYVDRYFPPARKHEMEQLVQNLKSAFKARLSLNDWMSPSTKAEAVRKLDSMLVKVGYPGKPRDYSKLIVRDDDPLGNFRRSAALEWNYWVGRLSTPVDRTEWFLTPQSDNAYNTGTSIEFPAALLQGPMYDAGADAAVNYGAIGSYIGHEITHGFDDEGRKVDAKGRQRNWWTENDAKQFELRAGKLGAQYSKYEALPGRFVNAQATMGENIADLGGVNIALDAYHASLHGSAPPTIDGLTGDQRFFLGWAQAWRGKLTDQATLSLLKSDPHSPRRFRVNGPVRNIDAWYAAFDVRAGQTLYLAPGDRVHMW